MKSQRQIVLDQLRIKPLTAMGVIDQFGIYRLAARIEELRKDGYPIISHRVEAPNRHGQMTKFVRYVLQEKP